MTREDFSDVVAWTLFMLVIGWALVLPALLVCAFETSGDVKP